MTDFQRARTAEQRAIRRRMILDTAAAMLDEAPVSAVSLNELSRRVGLAKSNVLRYFESREAVLLELLDRAWQQWLSDLPSLLAAGVDPQATAADRGEQFAAVLTASLAERRMLCDLLSAQAGVLEHNVSPEVAARYKRAALTGAGRLADLIRAHLPELGERSHEVAAFTLLTVGAVWTHARPSPAMLAAYDADPSLAAMRMEFENTVRRMLATLVAGALTRTSP
ncbi:TetR/AcrR family transcriptional regulator [Streptomyces bohaiensis]|uniref:TetR/AcrR family transcriptional regulator n=1 Tax=Streptomyces bohaiensis TaxID=1431344 RepID=A0ABX1CDB1_9ACTN|nr:TetR/AcrR family transcriptional regulator [Streptomyces bohaiensis]NJQ17076.1 TetR/AcrR family transcriptional regulator [Streptomyces bohaiensis]